MPQQITVSVENNFTKGLVTDSTGLNFPENAATSCDNCEFTITGQTLRRLGINVEKNGVLINTDRTSHAVSGYKWNNAGGDGSTQIIVIQVGNVLYFYLSSSATETTPISARKLSSNIVLSSLTSFDATKECQYADGNGYLFVFHPNIDPIYVTYTSGVVSSTTISVNIRDFYGVNDNISDSTYRPTTLSDLHQYNLLNQGWTSGSPWSATSDFATVGTLGSHVFNIGTVSGITLGDQITASSLAQYYYPGGPPIYADGYMTFGGTVTAYAAPNVTINVTNGVNYTNPGAFKFNINAVNKGYINTWFTAEGNYPSNADVWWYFKNTSGTFDPATMQPKVTLSTGNAPQGHILLNAFNLNRASASGIGTLTSVSTNSRPSIGAWFQGRVWYSGLNDSFQPAGNASFYTWSENIYFSQVNVGTAKNFGNCYQTNDPTSENLFDLLPTDGGVISIQGSGKIYKLFPIQNGMLVFAANGVWFITGSQGIGFAANDYTITKISNVESMNSTSFVDVLGLPYFWNEDGIYQVAQQQGGGLAVQAVTVGILETLYDSIPKQSKKYVRGAYNPIDFVVQWIYKSTEETSVTDRYAFDKILNYNIYNKAFFPYSVDITGYSINCIVYVQGPGGADTISSGFKYFVSSGTNTSFANEYDETYVDWGNKNYSSYFVTGYKLRGQAIKKFQPQYIQIWNKTSGLPVYYQIQGIWDYANNTDVGRHTVLQNVQIYNPKYDVVHRRHKIRGHGYALQFKVTSQDGKPFNIIGWAVVDTVNAGT